MEIAVKKRIFTKRRLFIMIGVLCFVEAIVLAVILTAKYTCLIYECPISWVRPTLLHVINIGYADVDDKCKVILIDLSTFIRYVFYHKTSITQVTNMKGGNHQVNL